VFVGGAVVCSALALSYFGGDIFSVQYTSGKVATTTTPISEIPEEVVAHLSTPEPLKGAYMTSCIASGKKLRAPLVHLIDTTELNAVIIDIKDYTGMISFDAGPEFVKNVKGCFIPDLKEFLKELHEKNIYTIARVTVFQDTVYPVLHPDAAVKKKSDGSIWKDRKGITFIDPGATEYWAYMVDLGKAAHAIGFDEINYDYIRFPSDGDMSDIAFTRTGTTTKPAMMRKFYRYLGDEMHKAGITISADLFGMTTTNTDDLNIGQVLEFASPHFDYIAPMVYPSHYPPKFNGLSDPNKYPYEVVKYSLDRAVARMIAASTTPAKIRPWLQDFDYPVPYTKDMVRTQIQATYDAGLTSWMLWDPTNTYTPTALMLQ